MELQGNCFLPQTPILKAALLRNVWCSGILFGKAAWFSFNSLKDAIFFRLLSPVVTDFLTLSKLLMLYPACPTATGSSYLAVE